MHSSDPHTLDILKHTFGFSSFRGQQQTVVESVLAGRNTMVVMPTGGGKSLCYQLPALVRDGVGVVVSPLIALMQDQVQALKELGVEAGFLNSSLTLDELRETEQALRSNTLKLLYIAPERLLQERTLALLASLRISLFAIDEAHCVAQWGHDFRADYLRLQILHERFPNVPRVALTATADSRTQQEIVSRLQLDADAQFVCGFDRPNIQYRIRAKNKPRQQLLSFLRQEQKDNAGVIYCLSRRKVEETALWLQTQGVNALPYHAGLSSDVRQTNQTTFLREEGIVIVATIAFGMGIDKPNVRFVAHLDMPKSVEAYYQETGRAGRDGEPATALLLYGMEDVVKLSQMVASSEGNEAFKRNEQQRLNAMLGLCEMTQCRRQALLRYFGEQLSEPCGNCDNCHVSPETWDATEAARKALSCVYRTEQRFGAAHLIDVLRGADTERIRQFRHQEQSTYGIGKDLPLETWRSLFRQLIVLGYLQVDTQGYGSLLLHESCRPVLKGEQALFLRKDSVKPNAAKRAKVHDDIPEEDRLLWAALRACRKRLADEHGVPPYVVFSDATLKEMVFLKPTTDIELLSVTGVGDKKLEQYGEEFLEILCEYEYR